MKVLRAAAHKRMPWKNGGGETVEIAVFPKNSALGDFDWRVSMATVATDGPFSIFDGIDRTLSILSGDGMSLAIDGAEPVLLTKASAPLAFSADVPVTATLAGGTITDLNVMTQRSRFEHSVERLAIDGVLAETVQSGTVLLFIRDGAMTCTYDNAQIALEHDDALLLQPDFPSALELQGSGTVYMVHVRAL